MLFSPLAGCSDSRSSLAPVRQKAAVPEGPGVAGDIPARDLLLTEQVFIRVARKVTPAVVNISSVHRAKGNGSDEGLLKDFFGDLFSNPHKRGGRDKSLGSGFIVSREGLILTNHHVIADSERVTVRLSDRREFFARVIGRDPKSDLAVLKIPADPELPLVPLGDSEGIEVGEWAIAIGNPFGLDRTVTVGVISATGRTDLGLTQYDNFIQTDASINFGNSGGPLLNARGEVIGINTAIVAAGQGIGFAIPINLAREVMEALLKDGIVVRGWLGLKISALTIEAARKAGALPDRGVIVEEVIEESPAARGEIRAGDLVLRLEGKRVEGIRQFKRMVANLKPGTMVELSLLRNGRKVALNVMVGEDKTP